jgi:hypothetical protein
MSELKHDQSCQLKANSQNLEDNVNCSFCMVPWLRNLTLGGLKIGRYLTSILFFFENNLNLGTNICLDLAVSNVVNFLHE